MNEEAQDTKAMAKQAHSHGNYVSSERERMDEMLQVGTDRKAGGRGVHSSPLAPHQLVCVGSSSKKEEEE